jgi:hypothetical protein
MEFIDYELEVSRPTLDQSPQGRSNFLNLFMDALWQDDVIRTRARDILWSNDAVRSGMQSFLQSQYSGIPQGQQQQPEQRALGDLTRDQLVPHALPGINFSGYSEAARISQAHQPTNVAEGISMTEDVILSSALEGSSTENLGVSQNGDDPASTVISEWMTTDLLELPPMDDDLMKQFLEDTS